MTEVCRLGALAIAGMIRGAVATEIVAGSVHIHRLDPRFDPQIVDGFLRTVAEQAAGVRLALRTDASRLHLTGELLSMAVLGGPEPDPAPFEVVVDGHSVGTFRPAGAGRIWLDALSGEVSIESVGPATLDFALPGSGMREVQLWFPHDQIFRIVTLEADGIVLGDLATDRPIWVHYGSSISQGAGAARPTRTWPVRAANLAGFDLVNLGLSGNAVLDPFVARMIASLKAEVVSLKVGINVINRDCFGERTFGPALHGFLDLIRDGQPTTPIRLMTALHCELVERLPGPTTVGPDGRFVTLGAAATLPRGRLSLQRTREIVADVARLREDPRLEVVDGLSLYGPDDEIRLPLPDALHPSAVAHELIAQRFAHQLISTPNRRGTEHERT